MAQLTVRNPVARLTAAVEETALDSTPTSTRAPRLDSLQGVEIGLWWNIKVGGSVALEWLADTMAAESGTTSSKYYGRYPGAPTLITAAAEGSKAVIGATGD